MTLLLLLFALLAQHELSYSMRRRRGRRRHDGRRLLDASAASGPTH